MKRFNAKKITGFVLKFAVAVVVLAFLGLHSINFFMFVFPTDQEYYAWLGFGLTGGGAVSYLVVFLWEADTVLRKWISLAIAGLSGVGEILTALFGMRVEAWTRAGFAMTETDFDYMLLAVGLLALAHAAALAGYFAGDKIAELFGDEDGDGTPNYRDKDYKPNKSSSNQARTPQPATQTPRHAPQQQNAPQHSLDDFLRVAGMTREQAQVRFADRDAFMDFASGQFDYISGGNMKRIHGELTGSANPTEAARQNGNRR